MTEDSRFMFSSSNKNESFYKVNNIVSQPMHIDTFPKEILRVNFMLAPEGKLHQRSVYNMGNLFEQVGGVTYFLLLMFTVIMYPISKFCFVIKATKKMKT